MKNPSLVSALQRAFGMFAFTAVICGRSLATAQTPDVIQSADRERTTVEPSDSANLIGEATDDANAGDSSQVGLTDGRSKKGTEADFAEAIQDLASSTFQKRQSSFQTLVAAGTAAVDALENGAKTDRLEVGTRCVEALTRIARDTKSAEVALAALERLAADTSNRVAARATREVAELKMTDQDRAIAKLAAEGVRTYLDPSGEVISASISQDRQIALLRHLPQLRSVRMSGKDLTDAGVKNLAHLKKLSNLTISRTSMTDNGLRELKKLEALDRLSLMGSSFTSEGMREIRHVASLRSLSLHSPGTENDLRFLVDLTQIDSLYVSGARMSQEEIGIINEIDHLHSSLCQLAMSVTNN